MWWLDTYKLDLKSQYSYRLDFFLQLLIWSIYSTLPLIVVGALASHFPTSGMSQKQVHLVYCAVQIGYEGSRMFARALDDFHKETTKGNLDRLLIRPRPLLALVMSSRIFPRRLAGIAAGVVAGIAGLRGSDNVLLPLAMLIVSAISSALIFVGLLNMYAATCFWTVSRNLFSDIVIGSVVTLSLAPIENMATPLRILVGYLIPLLPGVQAPIVSAVNGQIPSGAVGICAASLGSSLAFCTASICLFYGARRFYQSPGS